MRAEIEVRYELDTPPVKLRQLFAAEVFDEQLFAWHDEPWLSRGLEPPSRTARQLRAEALASLLEHAKQPPAEHVLTLKDAASHLETSERSLRHDVDQGRYDNALTETRAGQRALRFRELERTWRLPRARRPDERVLMLMAQKGVGPGETFVWRMLGEERDRVCTRRRDGECWKERW